MQRSSMMPQLAIPFAIVGAAAGWLSQSFLVNPIIDVVIHGDRMMAAIVGGIVASALGALLTWQCRQRPGFNATDVKGPLLVAYMAMAGVFAGGAIGLLLGGSMSRMTSGAFTGIFCGLAFTPVGAMVLAAAKRADRARHGSIVAGADRRAVWTILAATLSVTTLAMLPDWPAFRYGEAPVPYIALAMVVGAGALIGIMNLADIVALYRVSRIARVEMESHELNHANEADEIPAVDLGLGDQVMARMEQGASAYRSRSRPVALLMGSVTEARAALRKALMRGVVGLGIVMAMFCCHWLATTVDATVTYTEIRCAQGHTPSCYRGAMVLQGNAKFAGQAIDLFEQQATAVDPPDSERAEELYLKACIAGNRPSCDAMVASRAARSATQGVDLPYWYSWR